MFAALEPSLGQTMGILFTFGGIGLMVNGIIVYLSLIHI